MAEARKRRREDPEVRKAQILAAARRTFLGFGLHATTVDRIAVEAGVSVGLLYRFFASKTAIMKAMIAEDVETQLEEVARDLEKASRRPETLPDVMSKHVIGSPLNREQAALQFQIAAEVCRDEDLRAFVRAKHSELGQRLIAEAEERSGDRNFARILVEQINLASAVASGLAMHSILYSDSPKLRADLVKRMMVAIFSQPNPT